MALSLRRLCFLLLEVEHVLSLIQEWLHALVVRVGISIEYDSSSLSGSA
jgi:hypothetical protein